MAKLEGNFEFTGSLGGVTAYRMKGCTHIVLRRTAGPSKNQIKNGSSFVRTRENYQEFGGVAKAAKHLRRALSWLDRVADYNFQPALNKVTKAIQKMDRVSGRGERNIYYSQNHDMLKGFNLNKYHLFDTIVRKPVTCAINSETGSAVVTIPSLQRGINLNLPWPTPQFRFVVSLGVCDDLLFNGTEYDENKMNHAQAVTVETAWQPADKPYAGEEINIKINHPEASAEHSSLVLAIGIVFDMSHRYFGNDRQSRYPTGSAKILDLAKAMPAAYQPLKLPFTIRSPRLSEMEQGEESLILLEKRQEARITEGFELQPIDEQEQTPPFTFSAKINVNNTRLWDVFHTLAGSFPEEDLHFVIGMKGVEPVTTSLLPKQKVLNGLTSYARELVYDTSLSFGLLLQSKDSLVELMVTESKYVNFRGVDKEQFLQLMSELKIGHVEQLEFIDEYPMVTLPLRKFLPGARLPETVIQELYALLEV